MITVSGGGLSIVFQRLLPEILIFEHQKNLKKDLTFIQNGAILIQAHILCAEEVENQDR